MKEKVANKLTLKAGNNILKLMGKANQVKQRVKKEIIQLQKDPIFALPKLPPSTNMPSKISTYCQILENDQPTTDSLNQNLLNTVLNTKKQSKNNLKIRHSSLSFMHESEFKSMPNNTIIQDTKLQTKKKSSNQMDVLTNKYSFLEIAQTSDTNYFIEKIFKPEIALFMNGANKVISVISQQKKDDNDIKKRINLNQISNYIIKTNKSLELEKQRTYDVKYVGRDGPSFELSENVDFLDSSISIITPNTPPFSYLFILNLVEEKEIQSFAKIIHQVKSLDFNAESDDLKTHSEVSNAVITDYIPYRQICQVCKKNCAFSIVLFLRQSATMSNEERESEKLANLFCEKKKSFFIDSYENKNDKNLAKDRRIENENSEKSDSINEKSEKNILSTDVNSLEALYPDNSSAASNDDDDDDFHPLDPPPQENVQNSNQDFLSLMVDNAESEIKETQKYVINHTPNILKNSPLQIQKNKEDINKEENNLISPTSSSSNHSSLFELLKKLNNSEKENKEKLEQISGIQSQLKAMEENILSIKSRQKKIKDESDQINLEISEIEKQSETQANENEKMKKNVQEMIIRTGQLKSKYNDLLAEIHEKERSQREKQRKMLLDKEKEMKTKMMQSESKWRKELEKRKSTICFIKNKENQNQNESIDQKPKHEFPPSEP